MEISMSDFKARNAEAQRINAEIQKAQGARDENERQFKALCAEYERVYGEPVNESNLAQILERVTTEVNAQAEVQAKAIEAARNGVIKTIPVAETAGTAGQAGVVSGVGMGNAVAGAGNAVAGVAQVGSVGAIGAVQGIPQPVAGAANTAQGIPQSIAGVAQPVVGTPVNAQITFDDVSAPKPMSAAALSSAAFAQGATQPDMAQPKEVDNHTPIQATNPIAGWNTQQGGVDFNTMLGGKFGG